MTGGSRPERRGGRFWRLLTGSEPDSEAPDSDDSDAEDVACTRICDCAEEAQGRTVVRVSGTLRKVGERTVAGLPAVEAELDDGSGSLEVVWLGRRSIAGVQPGREMVAYGRIATSRGRPVLFNPRYELRPFGTE
ncbi:OB-fold nucleic acid binding domain-containing protein [Streptomyces sp. ACA25]|uniref:OB-fold nucleic acid binding domain-containing protein n=1 Tax=Streptomyces sp. ACA25 TaxID=3022596 RepID=UPI002306E010|nr:OB-fold nucleic acid binding domain-containing protein [Streptomyces sp. ACA25]MDB1088794.1 OB-fold nucleic acid binding domain-containing protein [Streptomyces sp. ACA25]